MQHILLQYAARSAEVGDASVIENEAAGLIAELVAQCRPPKPHQAEHAANAIQALCHVLNSNPQLTELLRDSILSLLGKKKPVSLYVDSGIQPSSGFFSEMSRRFGHKLLPAAIDPAYLKDLFALIFPQAGDELWVLAVPDEIWLELLHCLDFTNAPDEMLLACQQNLLDALQVLSYRLSASGLEPELIRNHPELEDHSSPFIMQNVELDDFLRGEVDEGQDAKHILVMLDQCREVIGKIRRNSSQTGTNLHLTFLLQRMSQQIQRLECLLDILVNLRLGENTDIAFIHLFKTLVSAECHKNDMRLHWRENMELLALRVTENASRTGEHYITENRREYFELMRSAMGAGLIIGVMAMIKVMLASQHYAPLTEAICFSLNYGLGFVLIHILHFTVATKQPAMTAAAIAASIDASDGKAKEMSNLVDIIAQMMRSQIIAIIGNVIIVIPMAMLIALLIHTLSGHHFVTPEKALKLLKDVDPLHSGALIYAGIAGVCLFLSGLIAGYHDNIAIYNKIPQRLRALRWLQSLLGEPRLNRVAEYIENNLGALAGNFYFGCLLGGMSAIGVLLGLPVDIRHITFSSAFVGFSTVGLDFAVGWQTLLTAAIGLTLIGALNLTVSFSLALYVAMKSRKVSFLQWRLLVTALLTRMVQEPRQFFLPPKKESPEQAATDQLSG
ncbi:MAG TPA: site-specific recombinase [Methylophilaceae bacterium]